MKAIIINALKAKVEEIEVEELNLEKMYELIGCRCICIMWENSRRRERGREDCAQGKVENL